MCSGVILICVSSTMRCALNFNFECNNNIHKGFATAPQYERKINQIGLFRKRNAVAREKKTAFRKVSHGSLLNCLCVFMCSIQYSREQNTRVAHTHTKNRAQQHHSASHSSHMCATCVCRLRTNASGDGGGVVVVTGHLLQLRCAPQPLTVWYIDGGFHDRDRVGGLCAHFTNTIIISRPVCLVLVHVSSAR